MDVSVAAVLSCQSSLGGIGFDQGGWQEDVQEYRCPGVQLGRGETLSLGCLGAWVFEPSSLEPFISDRIPGAKQRSSEAFGVSSNM
jgi:hypothetical protein